MPRVVVPPEAVRGDRIEIRDPATRHHLQRVLRVKVGDVLECLDGQGALYDGVVFSSGRRHLTIAIQARRHQAPPTLQITLAQALIRPQRFEWMLEKATELGVARIIPMITMRTTVRDVSHGRVRRWQRIVATACAQCRRATVPSVDLPRPLRAVLDSARDQFAFLLTLQEGAEAMEQHLDAAQGDRAVTLLIGPEGDFCPSEVAMATHAGAHSVRLGQTTFRSETAALVSLVLLQHRVRAL